MLGLQVVECYWSLYGILDRRQSQSHFFFFRSTMVVKSWKVFCGHNLRMYTR